MIENAGIDASRIVAVSPLVEIPAAPADAGSGCYVGYASRFSHEKGFDALVEAARRSGVPFRLSRNEHGLVRVAVPAEMEVEVTRSKADLDAFYRGCRMLAFPSIWFETFGLVGAEAMSHGIPVLASRIGALTELVDDGVDGLLFEPGDSEDLARQVTRLWNDPELCRRLGAAGRAKAVARWSPEAHFRQVHAIYQAACGHVRAAAVADCAALRSAQPPPARAVQPAHPGRREPVAARDAR
jgi:glycosyltransferase involved in cell wall biosynthesis